jgi:very-short-patch-repair endonuclease
VLDDHLRRHDGVITHTQAQQCGLNQGAIDRLVNSGHWRRCARGVYFAADRPFTDEARTRAAVWGYGSGAAASGLAAAWWQGMTKFAPGVIEVTVRRDARLQHQAMTRLRRRDLSPRDIVERRGLRVTEPALTVVEACSRRGGGASLMDRALQGDLELDQLWCAHLRHKGRHGSPAARRLLQAASDGARSEAERLLIRLLRAAKISGWKANYPVCGYVVDVAFPKQKVAIEVDGWAFHSDQAAFQNDRQRQNRIALSGWQVLRFTWLDLTEHPQRVIAEIARALRQPR